MSLRNIGHADLHDCRAHPADAGSDRRHGLSSLPADQRSAARTFPSDGPRRRGFPRCDGQAARPEDGPPGALQPGLRRANLRQEDPHGRGDSRGVRRRPRARRAHRCQALHLRGRRQVRHRHRACAELFPRAARADRQRAAGDAQAARKPAAAFQGQRDQRGLAGKGLGKHLLSCSA